MLIFHLSHNTKVNQYQAEHNLLDMCTTVGMQGAGTAEVIFQQNGFCSSPETWHSLAKLHMLVS
jgi:hypothetical protein